MWRSVCTRKEVRLDSGLQEVCSDSSQATGIPESDFGALSSGRNTLARAESRVLFIHCCSTWSSLQFCMQVHGLMMSTFKVVPYVQFRTRGLQKEILCKWGKFPVSLDRAAWDTQSSPPSCGLKRSPLAIK